MKNSILLICLGLMINTFSLFAQSFDTKSIAKVYQDIRTINPKDENYQDLQFLKRDLKDSEIVLLGEQGHGDGSSFEAKSRLAKFLHQEMDFDVLVFESSILDCQIAWNDIKAGSDPYQSFGKGVFKFWAVSQYTSELIRYIGEQAQTSDPLVLAGFDMQFSGMMDFKERAKVINDFLEKGPADVQLEHLPHIKEYLENPYRFFKPKAKLDVDSTYTDALINELNMVADTWESKKWANEDAQVSRFFANTPRLMYFIWNLDFQNIDPDVANIRDEVMAQNLIWLKETVYPGKKLIVWGANSHFGYNRNLLQPGDHMIPMGQHLKDRYGDKTYTMALTSFDGQSGSIVRDTITQLPPAPVEGIESSLNTLGSDYGYINLRSKKAKKCLDGSFLARIYGFANFSGDWTKMADGLFYINTMEPNVAREER